MVMSADAEGAVRRGSWAAGEVEAGAGAAAPRSKALPSGEDGGDVAGATWGCGAGTGAGR